MPRKRITKIMIRNDLPLETVVRLPGACGNWRSHERWSIARYLLKHQNSGMLRINATNCIFSCKHNYLAYKVLWTYSPVGLLQSPL